ncbi:MAG: PQQ-like beta-propeller repeat protein, partial [Candidatus Glassbacteria bacterium]|nr:PQQ-like beta-propeller repeat protein [Candidatus Glassbacteria bacterium]
MKFSRGFTFLLCFLFTAPLPGSDWPMWRRDANRSASSPADLPAALHLLWERIYTPRTMVWDDPLNQDLMPYDQVFEPVVAGGRMFLGFNDCDKVVALDTDSGEEVWTFYTDGPVRLPPVAWENRVYFASDDSYLYCVEAETGKLLWKFRGGPSEKKIIGNRRLLSAWPSRGGPVIQDSTVYFAASIWPFMGTFIYALDAGTGEVEWVNDRTGSEYILQPHHSPAFAGVAPQGALVSAADRLLVPGGRSVPACFDRIGGGQLYYHLSDQNKTGGSFVCASAEVGVFFNHHRDQVVSMYDLETGNRLVPEIGRNPVLTETTFYLSTGAVSSFDAVELKKKSEQWREASLLERELARALEPLAGPDPGLTGKYYCVSPALIGRLHREWFEYKAGRWKESILWEVEADGSQDLIKAGGFLYAAGSKGVTAIKLPAGEEQQPEIAWSKTVRGGCRRLLAAGGRLFVSTLDGRIMAFGGTEASPNRIPRRVAAAHPDAEAVVRARNILQSTGVKEGYALVRGVRDGGLLEALALSSELRIIAFHPDSARVVMLRSRLDSAGLYGERIAVLREHPGAGPALPPYLASLTVAGDLPQSLPEIDSADAAGTSYFERLINSVRPYGGKAWLGVPKAEQEALINRLSGVLNRSGLELTPGDEGLVLTRRGSPPGSASWTH